MKKIFRTGFMTALAVIVATGWCYAATIMFPYINSNPGNLSTIVSVINTAAVGNIAGVAGVDTLQLHYRYMTKTGGAAAIDACQERDFYRPSTSDDLVSFDAAGYLGDGLAMLNDATNYNDGAGAPAFDLPNMGQTDARRGYLLVNHRVSNTLIPVFGNERPQRAPGMLDGEVMLLDVVNGAAWGYKAILADQTLAGLNQGYAFATLTAGANPLIGATTELLAENVSPQLAQPLATLYPPDEFQTRFFVTPLVIHHTVNGVRTTSNDMSDVRGMHQKRTRIVLRDANGNVGVTDRDENPASGGGAVHVRCVAGIDLNSLTGGSFGPWFDEQGGWAFVDLLDPVSLDSIPNEVINDLTVPRPFNVNADHCAVVFKLQFGAPSWTGGPINSCDIIRTDRIED